MFSEFSCLRCRQRYRIDARFAGRIVACRKCGQHLQVPLLSAASSPVTHAGTGDPDAIEDIAAFEVVEVVVESEDQERLPVVLDEPDEDAARPGPAPPAPSPEALPGFSAADADALAYPEPPPPLTTRTSLIAAAVVKKLATTPAPPRRLPKTVVIAPPSGDASSPPQPGDPPPLEALEEATTALPAGLPEGSAVLEPPAPDPAMAELRRIREFIARRLLGDPWFWIAGACALLAWLTWDRKPLLASLATGVSLTMGVCCLVCVAGVLIKAVEIQWRYRAALAGALALWGICRVPPIWEALPGGLLLWCIAGMVWVGALAWQLANHRAAWRLGNWLRGMAVSALLLIGAAQVRVQAVRAVDAPGPAESVAPVAPAAADAAGGLVRP